MTSGKVLNLADVHPFPPKNTTYEYVQIC
eukprot:SAG31_NODE_9254_length_1308_cov_1.113317_3_plen_28_part_01